MNFHIIIMVHQRPSSYKNSFGPKLEVSYCAGRLLPIDSDTAEMMGDGRSVITDKFYEVMWNFLQVSESML
jgi:hypothetical protein